MGWKRQSKKFGEDVNVWEFWKNKKIIKSVIVQDETNLVMIMNEEGGISRTSRAPNKREAIKFAKKYMAQHPKG